MSIAKSTQPLSSQVGGHAGVLTTEDGSLVIKPALPLELKFYESLAADTGFAPLKAFIPKFFGTLKLQGQLDETAPPELGISSLVLENLSHTFVKPNILDIKLGTVLYDKNAPPEKVARMEQAARDTTSFETGIRLTGFQVYDNITGLAVNTPKSFGKSIKAADLPEGIARFFPIAPSIPGEGEEPLTVSSGLPRELLLPIIRAIKEDVVEFREAFKSVDMRMAGGSLLIIYEADHARAEEGLKQLRLREEENVNETEENDDDDDDDDDDDSEEEKRTALPFSVKLIDFAHTHITPGEGPDTGVLLGVDTVLSLLEGRIQQIMVENV